VDRETATNRLKAGLFAAALAVAAFAGAFYVSILYLS
jgi:hypothetical protein